jgi:hypothetical protein
VTNVFRGLLVLQPLSMLRASSVRRFHFDPSTFEPLNSSDQTSFQPAGFAGRLVVAFLVGFVVCFVAGAVVAGGVVVGFGSGAGDVAGGGVPGVVSATGRTLGRPVLAMIGRAEATVAAVAAAATTARVRVCRRRRCAPPRACAPCGIDALPSSCVQGVRSMAERSVGGGKITARKIRA